jgi:hypothetical protein
MTINRATVLAVAAVLGAPQAVFAQQDEQRRMAVPFGVGEKLDYQVKFGAISVGQGSMEVVGVEEIRGRPTWHTVFRVKGGTFFYKVDDRFESWVDVINFASLRHRQQIDEGRRERERVFEIYPDRETYVEDNKQEKPSVKEPLDDGSFLYFIRTVPLEVGQTYEFNRYFRPDRNPVKITVVRKEKIKVPAGTFDAVVVRPSIKTKGIFSESGHAEVWLSDDDKRIMLQMKSKLSFGSLSLYLKSYRPAPVVQAASTTQ